MEHELFEKDPMEIIDMDNEDLMKFSRKELVKAVIQFADEAHSWESKCTNVLDDYIDKNIEEKKEAELKLKKMKRKLKKLSKEIEERDSISNESISPCGAE